VEKFVNAAYTCVLKDIGCIYNDTEI
jgi:hypothetical protein